MSTTFVQGARTTAFSSSTARSVAFGSPNTQGNFLFCSVFLGVVQSLGVSIFDTAGNLWLPISAPVVVSLGVIQAFYCQSAVGGVNTVKIVDQTAGTYNRALVIGEWSSPGNTLILDQFGTLDQGFGVTSSSSPVVTTLVAAELLVGHFWTQSASETFSSSGGNTVQVGGSGSGNSCLADQVVGSTGPYSSTVTFGSTTAATGSIATFQIAASNPAPFNTTIGRIDGNGLLIGNLLAPIWSGVNVVPVTVNANSTSDQSLMALIIPANTLNRYGKTLNISLSGVYTTPGASTATLEFKVKLGSLTLIDIVTTANAGSITNNKWSLNASIVTQTNGTSAAFEAAGNLTVDLGALTSSASSIFSDTNTSTVGTLDATAAQTLQVTVAFSAGSASNTCTQRQLVLNTVN